MGSVASYHVEVYHVEGGGGGPLPASTQLFSL